MNNKWYLLSTEEVCEELGTNQKGLSKKECEARIEKYGKNELPKKKRDGFFKIMLHELKDPIVLILIVTIIFSLIIGEVVDALVILFIVLIDLIMGTVQEWNASRNAEALANLIRVKVKVIRDSKEQEIDSSELVVGDIVLLESGNKISGDLRIISAQNLTIDESVLTGESINVVKHSDTLEKGALLAERKNMAYSGTSVITGRATCVVVNTGINTELGKIATKVSNTKDEKSPLTIRMEKFSKEIAIMIIAVATIITAVLALKGTPGSEIFLSVIALSVSAMPEGLPLALTMVLTIASNRMSKKNVIVKKLNSVESLGSCTVIASDKTGTLTVNEQTAKKIVLPSGLTYEVEGTGYNDVGRVLCEDKNELQSAYDISKYAVINNEAGLEKVGNTWNKFGDSIDVAFLALGKKLNVNLDDIEIVGRIPYESFNKYSAVFYKQNDEVYCTVKGSLEKVLEFSSTMQGKGKHVKLNEKLLTNQNNDLAEEGYRVIAIANGKVKNFKKKDFYTGNDISDLCFEGLVAFIDPVREEVKGSIKECMSAGIKVVMITGDHPLTAFTIAKELSITKNIEEVATGEDVEKALKKGHEYFDDFVKKIRVFSRVTPIEKLEIVESYKRQKEFVAVTGDGVNDAPAIKSANIGISMGSGTDVAKETASMIVIDDNFKSIVAGVKEGRNAYSNIRKVAYMLLSCGVAEVLFFILSIIFDLPMPLVAIQLLWLNLVTDGIQDIALSCEKAEASIMKEKPRRTDETIFNRTLFEEVALSGLFIGGIVFIVWYVLLNKVGMEIDTARGYVLALMVFMQNVHVFNCRSEKDSTFKISLKSNPIILVAIIASLLLQVLVMEVPALSEFLTATSIPLEHLLILFVSSLSVLAVMEIYKYLRYRRKK